MNTEIETLSKIKGERIVTHFKSFIDSNNWIYIQMEFCCDNLANIVKHRDKVFHRSSDQPMDRIEYYIWSQIFIELLEAVKYLHELSPPLMHRDLKPANILFTDKGLQTGIFFKLCDFGLAKFQQGDKNTQFVGSQGYMAPEVIDGDQYGPKADLYSLGKIECEIFQIKLSR